MNERKAKESPMIIVKDVHKSYGSQYVLKGVGFTVGRGAITSIIGRSGGGKSVLMKQMMGLELPDTGEIFIDNEEICCMASKELNRIRKRIGILFQDGALFDSLTVYENVAFPLVEHTRLKDDEIAEVVNEKLTEVGLGNHEKKFPHEISGGMRKRAGLARALVLDPEIVFFDEPTSGLDPISKGSIYDIVVKTHLERSVTYVIVSHDIRGVMDISNSILMLWEGKIRINATPQEMEQMDDQVLQQFLAGKPADPADVE
jgi:phospholipid/cholesterol/gamma-HCH transport system ATP-binding protein